ncbi:unnamed protein product [Ambrosiozyma monospora]|uniref:Unnamed protein product n=1 Tax=Ambrosiozyma monospora TaxID=43982 RepID=A0ACB5SXE6_AMBMO|nr:unnamed protein product [Ambrosiozyma monospora]
MSDDVKFNAAEVLPSTPIWGDIMTSLQLSQTASVAGIDRLTRLKEVIVIVTHLFSDETTNRIQSVLSGQRSLKLLKVEFVKLTSDEESNMVLVGELIASVMNNYPETNLEIYPAPKSINSLDTNDDDENIDVTLISRNLAPLRHFIKELEIPLGVRGINHFTRLHKLKLKITDGENNILSNTKLVNSSLQKLTISGKPMAVPLKMSLLGLSKLKSIHFENAVIDSDTFETLPETTTKLHLAKCLVSGTISIPKKLSVLKLWHSFPTINCITRSQFTPGVKLALRWMPDDENTEIVSSSKIIIDIASCLREVKLEPKYGRPSYAKLVPIGFDPHNSGTTLGTAGNDRPCVSLEFGEDVKTMVRTNYYQKLCYLYPVNYQKPYRELLTNIVMACMQCFEIKPEDETPIARSTDAVVVDGDDDDGNENGLVLDTEGNGIKFDDNESAFDGKLEALFEMVKDVLECELVRVESKTPFPPLINF